MSADNWTTCPKCLKINQAKLNENNRKLDENYGKISIDEFNKLQKQCKTKVIIADTLREDYEVGIYKGVFGVTYDALCTECGFKFEFKKKIDISKD